MQILFTEEQLQKRIAELGKEITQFYHGKNLTVVTLLTGAMPFAMDLSRKIEFSVWMDTLAASSYENDRSSGKMNIRSSLKLPVQGRHILLIDDIFDTGYTLKSISAYLNSLGAESLKSCVLLDKNIHAEKKCMTPDWIGFKVPDQYIIGYGMDSNEEYRNLPYIAVL